MSSEMLIYSLIVIPAHAGMMNQTATRNRLISHGY